MCPPADIALDVSDEQVISYLDRLKPGSPLPKNVLDGINPYQYKPSNLPDGIWYIVHSTEKKENEFGFWEVKGEASEIFTNSSISGWRTTLEFFELESLERRTDLVMQEYRITQKGQCGINKEKELRAMCRVFLSAARSSNKEMHPKSEAAVIDSRNHIHTVPSIALSIDSISRKGSTSGSLMKTVVDSTTLRSEADKLLDPQLRDISELQRVFNGDYLELDDFADPQSLSTSSDNSSRSSMTFGEYFDHGDYLELDDLADPQSLSTSSDNASRSSMTFGEYFDPIALLQDLEHNSNQGQQGKDSSSRLSVTASSRPFEVVLQPATSGSLVSATGRQQPSGCKLASSVSETKFLDDRVINRSVKRLNPEQRDEGPSFSHGVVALSSTATAIPNEEKKAAVVKTKRLKKYFCFMPF